MFLLDRRNFLRLTGATVASGAIPGIASAAAKADVFTSDPNGALVDSVVIMGETNAALIDGQFNMANATNLADMIAATGRTLETVFITHKHPDHLLGLEAIVTRFPDAKVVTHAKIRPEIEKSAQGYLDYISQGAPAGTFASKVVIPDALDADHIELEGERIDILEPTHGDTGLISAVLVPSMDTLIASDFLYADTFAWTAENTTPDLVDAWLASLDGLESIGAGTVVPGHQLEGSPRDPSLFAQTRSYLETWKTALETTDSAEALKAAMMEGNDGLGLGFALDRAIAAAYPNG
ncbi:MAG: MBL fold metallo-hydrolase [Pseudomonadota bacterium]